MKGLEFTALGFGLGIGGRAKSAVFSAALTRCLVVVLLFSSVLTMIQVSWAVFLFLEMCGRSLVLVLDGKGLIWGGITFRPDG